MADEALIQAITEALLASNHAGWRRMVAGYKNADGSITMAGAGVGKVWARPPEDSRGGTAVWGSAAYANAPLIVGPGFDGDYEVKGADWLTASISFGEGSRVIDQPPGMGELVPDSIPAKALKIGRVELSPNGGLNFRVSKHAYTGGYWTSEADQDASAEVPGTAGFICWVGAYHLPSANTVGIVATTPVFGEQQGLDESDLANLVYPAGAVPLGPAFTLQNGQAELSTSRFAELDPRIFLSPWDADSGVQSVVAGTNVTVDDTDPANPIVSATGGGGGATIGSAAYASRPAAGNAGDLFLPSDGYSIQRDDGADWIPWGPIFPLTEPPTSGWTLTDNNTVTVTAAKGAITLVTTTLATTQLSVYYRTAPTPPYVITACILYNFILKGGTGATSTTAQMGLCFRQSGDGKLAVLVMGDVPNGARSLSSDKWTNSTTFSAAYSAERWNQNPIWFRIADDNTNRICSVSMDGQNFDTFHSVGRTDFLTADQVGLVLRAQTTSGVIARATLLSWKET